LNKSTILILRLDAVGDVGEVEVGGATGLEPAGAVTCKGRALANLLPRKHENARQIAGLARFVL
jgi:hypothetical protein